MGRLVLTFPNVYPKVYELVEDADIVLIDPGVVLRRPPSPVYQQLLSAATFSSPDRFLYQVAFLFVSLFQLILIKGPPYDFSGVIL